MSTTSNPTFEADHSRAPVGEGNTLRVFSVFPAFRSVIVLVLCTLFMPGFSMDVRSEELSVEQIYERAEIEYEAGYAAFALPRVTAECNGSFHRLHAYMTLVDLLRWHGLVDDEERYVDFKETVDDLMGHCYPLLDLAQEIGEAIDWGVGLDYDVTIRVEGTGKLGHRLVKRISEELSFEYSVRKSSRPDMPRYAFSER